MSDKIVLYDLPARDGKAWSLNPWKTRLFLNYKGIPYKTEWIEYPDLQPAFEKLGIPPNESGFKYTSPTIRLPNGSYIMESKKIAWDLESRYPDPPLQLDPPMLARVEAILQPIVTCLRPVFVPLVPKVFLNPVSQAYFIPSREKGLGKSLDEFAKGGDQGIEDAKPHVKELAGLLGENPDGPFFLGKQVSYVDFVVVAWLKMLVRLGVEERIWGLDGGSELKALYDASAKWLERDS
ncbi:uncharacterized protein A1O9_06179 [Exophiala aquamarina CBS 119918]|uniref:Uncharacterized protein n=1 Tax=Exophiala aquamarina CBS 119918 TaxID=1182545 RepID=A0A072PG57_9EURO|nr:uncharacterized protein A1O9_06179 [Exophiala aquamarina CBS 119918]KEF58253.1 hypothetical protein A1O9_06179 [Exophiala aquamarina CBS 119918]